MNNKIAHAERIKVWSLCILTMVLSLIVNTFVLIAAGFNLFGFTYMVFLPLGGLAMGFACCSGYYLYAKEKHYQNDLRDFIFLVVLACVFVFAIHYLPYLIVREKFLAEHLNPPAFLKFLNHLVTTSKHHLKAGRSLDGYEAAGDAGWFLLMLQTIAVLAVARTVYSWTDRKSSEVWQD